MNKNIFLFLNTHFLKDFKIWLYFFSTSLFEVIYILLLAFWVAMSVEYQGTIKKVKEFLTANNFAFENSEYSIFFAAMTLIFILIYTSINLITQTKIISLSHNFCSKLQKNYLTKKISTIQTNELDEQNKIDCIRVITELLPRASDTVFIPFITIAQKFISILLMTLVLFLVSPQASLIIILFLGIFFMALNKLIQRWVKDNVKNLSLLVKDRARLVTDIINSLYEINIFQRSANFISLDSINSLAVVKVRVINSLTAFIPKYSFEALLILSIVILAMTNAYFENGQDITSLSIIGLSLLRIGPQAQIINQSINLIKANIWTLPLEIVNDKSLFEDNFEEINENAPSVDSLKVRNLKLQIPFKDLMPIDFSVSKGDFLLLSGESGSGKSTFLRMLMNDFSNRDSAFRFSPESLNQLNSKILMTFCGQSPTIISGTVRENILFGSSLIDELKLQEAIKFSCLDDFIVKRGLNFSIIDAGENLSGGEKARIGICRAYYNNNSNIMLFDEPTASLDAENANQICQNIRRWVDYGNICIVVSHDNLLKNYCDKTIEFKTSQ